MLNAEGGVMDELKNKDRAILLMMIMGSILALIATWYTPDQREHTQK
jgi:hypothetical protein